MNYFKRLMVERNIENINRLLREIEALDGLIEQCTARQWFKKRQLRGRIKEQKSYIRALSMEIERESQ